MRTLFTLRQAYCFFILESLLLPSVSIGAQTESVVLFEDNFDCGSPIDESKWYIRLSGLEPFIKSRTDINITPTIVEIEPGNCAVQLEHRDYDPDYPGVYFLGTEIFSRQEFGPPEPGEWYEFEARVRVQPMPDGIVTSFFAYGEEQPFINDEIDFEFLSNQINDPPNLGDPVFVNPWNDSEQRPWNPLVVGLDLNEFNTFRFRWATDYIGWFWIPDPPDPPDPVLIHDEIQNACIADFIADSSMSVYFNFWASDCGWWQACDEDYLPTSTPPGAAYYYDIDYVRVIPEPSRLLLLGSGFAGLIVIGRGRMKP